MLMALGCGCSFKLHCQPWEGSFSGLDWRQSVPSLVEPAGKITASSQNCLFQNLPEASFTPGLSRAASQEQTQLASPLGLLLPAQPQTGKSSSLRGWKERNPLPAPLRVPLGCPTALGTRWPRGCSFCTVGCCSCETSLGWLRFRG